MSARSTIVFFLILVVFAAQGCRGSVEVSEPDLDQALKTMVLDNFREHFHYLADDKLQGRAPGTDGYQLSAEYVAQQFRAMGLAPLGDPGQDYYQRVPLRTTRVVEKESSLVLIRHERRRSLVVARDFLLQQDCLRSETNLKAPAVFVGFGVTAPDQDYDDYEAIEVKGKIVVALFGAPAHFPHNQRAYYSSIQEKLERASGLGAVGFLVFLSPEDQQRVPWERQLRKFRSEGMCWLSKSGRPHHGLAGIQGGGVLSQSGAQALFGAAGQSLEEIFALAKKGQAQAFDLPVELEIKSRFEHREIQSPNILAVLPGSDPRLSQEYVLYTAHLDHLGVDESIAGDGIYNGAFDNASGVAGLLEVARAFKALPRAPLRSILFAAVTAEERGLVGSDYLAHNPTVGSGSIVACLNMDMFVMLYPLQDVIAFGAEHSSLGGTVERAASRLGLKVSPDPFPEEVIFIRSDHYSFVRQGVPSIFVEAGMKTDDSVTGGVALVQEFLRTRYHTPQDDIHQSMDLGAGVKLAQINFLTGWLVASNHERPRWTAGDFFGEKYGK